MQLSDGFRNLVLGRSCSPGSERVNHISQKMRLCLKCGDKERGCTNWEYTGLCFAFEGKSETCCSLNCLVAGRG